MDLFFGTINFIFHLIFNFIPSSITYDLKRKYFFKLHSNFTLVINKYFNFMTTVLANAK